MTLILKLDLDMVRMYLCTKNEVPNSSRSDRQTDRWTDPTEIIIFPHTRMVKVQTEILKWTYHTITVKPVSKGELKKFGIRIKKKNI